MPDYSFGALQSGSLQDRRLTIESFRMKTDKWFYELFLSQPGMLAESIPGVDAGWQFSYSAVVVKEKDYGDDYAVTGFETDEYYSISFLSGG